MEIGPALTTIIAIVLALTALGIFLRSRDGRIAPTGKLRNIDPAEIGIDRFADRATLVQFSTDMCSRCPAVRRLLVSIAANSSGVDHVEVNLTNRADLASRFSIMQTPTTLMVDRDGIIRARIAGSPSREAVREHLLTLEMDHHASPNRH